MVTGKSARTTVVLSDTFEMPLTGLVSSLLREKPKGITTNVAVHGFGSKNRMSLNFPSC